MIDPDINSLLTIMSKDNKTKFSYSKCEYINKKKRNMITIVSSYIKNNIKPKIFVLGARICNDIKPII